MRRVPHRSFMQEKNSGQKIEALIDKGNFKKALLILKACRLSHKGRGEGEGLILAESEYYFLLAECYRGLGFFDTAIKHYSAVRGQSTGVSPERSIQTLLRLAACHRALGNSRKALFFAEKAFSESLESRLIVSDARLELALAYRLKGDFKKAEKELKTLLKIYSKEKDLSALSFVLWALGGVYRLEGRHKESIAAFKTSIKHGLKTGDKISSGYSMFGLAGVMRIAGFIDKSEYYYRKARDIFSKTQDIFGKAYSECGLANALRQKGLLQEALKRYAKAHRLYSLIRDRADLGFVEWGTGEILKKQGKLREALKHFIKALNLFKNKSEIRGEILAEISIAQILYLLGNPRQADGVYFKAVKKARKRKLRAYIETFT